MSSKSDIPVSYWFVQCVQSFGGYSKWEILRPALLQRCTQPLCDSTVLIPNIDYFKKYNRRSTNNVSITCKLLYKQVLQQHEHKHKLTN